MRRLLPSCLSSRSALARGYRDIPACSPPARPIACQANMDSSLPGPPEPADPPRLPISIGEVNAQLGPRNVVPTSAGAQAKPGPVPRSFGSASQDGTTRLRTSSRRTCFVRRSLDPKAAAKASAIGLSPEQFGARLEELLLLMPQISVDKLLYLEDGTLKELVSKTTLLADRLVRITSGARAISFMGRGQGLPLEMQWDKQLQLLAADNWEALNCKAPLHVFEGHTDKVTSVAVTPDGRHVVSGSEDSSLRVWDLQARSCVAALQGHTAGVTALAIAPDGRHAVSGSDDRSLRVWDLRGGTCVATLQGHAGGVTAVAVTPDGLRAVSGGKDGTLHVWDLQARTCTATFNGPAGVAAAALAVAPDGGSVLSAGRDGAVRVWDLQGLASVCTATITSRPMEERKPLSQQPVASLAITPDGRHAVGNVKSRKFGLCVWDLRTHACVGLYSCTKRLWSFSTSKGVAITPDGRHAVSGLNDAVTVWDLHAGKEVAQSDGSCGHRSEVRAVAITPDGRHAVSGGYDKTVRVWDLQAMIATGSPAALDEDSDWEF